MTLFKAVSVDLLNQVINALHGLAPNRFSVEGELRAIVNTPDDLGLDERMKAAGMFTVAELLKGAPLDAVMTHAGVKDLETFAQWIEMKRAQYLTMQARYDLGEKAPDDLHEWVVAHSAVFTEVHVNLKAAIAGDSSSYQKVAADAPAAWMTADGSRYVRVPRRDDSKYSQYWDDVDGGPVFDGQLYCNHLSEVLKRNGIILVEEVPEETVEQ